MNVALILSGGTGVRLGGDVPKQYIEVEGRPIISWCLEAFENHGQIDAIQVVAESVWHDFIKGFVGNKLKGFSRPGKIRQMSVLNGLTDILEYSGRDDIIIIHDAARPLVSNELISSCLEACKVHDGAIPVIPVKDTMYIYDGARITSLIERESLCAGQAPEAFAIGKYYDANIALLPEKIMDIKGATEPAVIAGLDVAIVPGDEKNFKITTLADLERFKQIIDLK